jgi:hypothetical protein
VVRNRLKGGPAGQVNLGFHVRKGLSEDYAKFRHAPSKISPALLGRKLLKSMGFKGHHIIKTGRGACPWPALAVVMSKVL